MKGDCAGDESSSADTSCCSPPSSADDVADTTDDADDSCAANDGIAPALANEVDGGKPCDDDAPAGNDILPAPTPPIASALAEIDRLLSALAGESAGVVPPVLLLPLPPGATEVAEEAEAAAATAVAAAFETAAAEAAVIAAVRAAEGAVR